MNACPSEEDVDPCQALAEIVKHAAHLAVVLIGCRTARDSAWRLPFSRWSGHSLNFFAISGFALVGLPGTLGFCAEDLLFQGGLEAHPFLGLALPLGTALNAINLYRLLCRLFLGSREAFVPLIPDAPPRERWPFVAGGVFLVLNGLFPAPLVRWSTRTAEQISNALADNVFEVRR